MGNAKDSFVDVAAGQSVFRAGQAADAIYVVESGQLEMVHDKPADVSNFSAGPGEFVGEEAVLDRQTYAATALAKSDCRLLRIDRAAFPDLVRHTPDIGLNLIRTLATRQWHRQRCLVQALQALSTAAPPPVPSPAKASVPARPKPAAVPSSPAPVPSVSPVQAPAPVPEPVALALRVGGEQVLALDPQRDEFQVGRPDPVTGAQPQIDLGPFDSARTLSRRHAKIVRDGGVYFICEDAPTTNGTFLNGTRLETGSRSALKPGDKLRFGSIEVEVIA